MLRHGYASMMLAAGESVVTLAQWLGHSSPTVTLRCCAHFMPEAGKKWARGRRRASGEPGTPLSFSQHGYVVATVRNQGMAAAWELGWCRSSASSTRARCTA